MRRKLGSLMLAVSLSMAIVISPFSSIGVSIAIADEENTIRTATLQADGSVVIRVKNSVESETDITAITSITDEEGNSIAIESAVIDGRNGTIVPSGTFEMGHTYTLSIEGYESCVIDVASLFSTDAFEEENTYTGDDLGANYSSDKTIFKVWSPTATAITLNLYESGDASADDLIQSYEMTKGDKSVWEVEVEGDLNGTYYTYSAVNDGTERETGDPYAKAVGINGDRAMVIDLDTTDPEGWDADGRQTVENITDAIIYELHVRDFSTGADTGIPAEHVGKYLAFTDKGTTTSNGTPTGIDHIADLGVNMVHILPSYDFGSVDETSEDGYNWGYDPKNYQVPEGSYSTNASDGAVRINEYKQMVMALHSEGIGVIQDCVYNHTQSMTFCYNILAPGYFHRANSNGSGCGNDVASERSMVRKYIVDSVIYWAQEYHMDGFRFDLMGLEDVDTMMAVREALDEIDSNIIVYGEGWTLTTSITKDILLATQKNCSATEGIAYFSDGIRDAVVNASFASEGLKKGYANGSSFSTDEMKMYIEARYTSNAADLATSPAQVVNYVTCHDGYTLWDKINRSNPDDSEEDKIKQQFLSEAMIITAQGVPFILSGDEFLRTKNFDENSYKSGDGVNALDYTLIEQHPEVYEYFKGLIAFRKAHAALRYTTFDEIDETFTWLDESQELDSQVMAYTIDGGLNGEISDKLLIIYNPNTEESTITLPDGEWKVCINGEKAGTDVIETVSGEITVTPISCYALVQGETEPVIEEPAQTGTSTSSSTSSSTSTNADEDSSFPTVAVVIIVIIVAVVVIVVVVSKKKN